MNNETKECKYLSVDDCCMEDNPCGLTSCQKIKDCYYKQLLAEQANNKKLVEALELVKNNEFSCSYDSDHYLYNECKRCKIKGDCIKHQAQQALNEVNK